MSVRLRVYGSIFVPLAKWSMLLTGNDRRIAAAGTPFIERVDDPVQLIAQDLGLSNSDIDATVEIVDQRLSANDPLPA